jgi:hypothetical protein
MPDTVPDESGGHRISQDVVLTDNGPVVFSLPAAQPAGSVGSPWIGRTRTFVTA